MPLLAGLSLLFPFTRGPDNTLVTDQAHVQQIQVIATTDLAQPNPYFADSRDSFGTTVGSGRIVENTLMPTIRSQASLVRTIDTSGWSFSSPDPTGVALLPSGQLLIADSEVDEMPRYFRGTNLFEATVAGNLINTYSTMSFSTEPSDVTVNPSNGHRFFSDDNRDRIFEVGLGADGRYGTADDIVTSFDTRAFKSFDPEGLAFGQNSLFVSDGAGAEVYKISPGINGIFDGVAPAGDDEVSHFDTASIGQSVPEGITFNADTGTLYIVSNQHHTTLVETTTAGTPLQVIDISFLHAVAPSGLAYAPSDQDPSGKSLYIADRGIDNNVDRTENDGKVYEIALGCGRSSATLKWTTLSTNAPMAINTPIAERMDVLAARHYKVYVPIMVSTCYY